MRIRGRYPPGWREYQKRLKRETLRRSFFRRMPLLGICSALSLVVMTFVFGSGAWISGHLGPDLKPPQETETRVEEPRERLDRKALSDLVRDLTLDPKHLGDYVNLAEGRGRVSVEWSLDKDLQAYILGLLRRSRTVRSAVVVMSPGDGRILAMASHDKAGASDNPVSYTHLTLPTN